MSPCPARLLIFTIDILMENIFRAVKLGIIHLVSTQRFPKTNISYPLIRTCTYL